MTKQTKVQTTREIARKRADAVHAACMDERIRFNAAVKAGHVAILPTFAGDYEVISVSSDHWYTTVRVGETARSSALNQRSWAGCNDGTWAMLMAAVGEKRHPLFAAFA